MAWLTRASAVSRALDSVYHTVDMDSIARVTGLAAAAPARDADVDFVAARRAEVERLLPF